IHPAKLAVPGRRLQPGAPIPAAVLGDAARAADRLAAGSSGRAGPRAGPDLRGPAADSCTAGAGLPAAAAGVFATVGGAGRGGGAIGRIASGASAALRDRAAPFHPADDA